MNSDYIKSGVERAPNRSLLYALGYTDEELRRPIIGVVSSHNEIVPGHMNLDKIEEAVKLLEIKEPTEIRNENGMLLVKAGSFMNIRKEDIIPMTASYIKAEKDTESDDISPENMTTLIKHYQEELQAYKKGYET